MKAGPLLSPKTYRQFIFPLRKKFGKQLRLWGGIDKRELTKDRRAIDDHLRSLAPLVEEGGFIPTVDHLVPPDVPLANFFILSGTQ